MKERSRLSTLVALSLGLLACGDRVILVECPLGTRPVGSECIPLDSGDVSVPPDTQGPVPDITQDTSTPPPDLSSPGDTDPQPGDTSSGPETVAPGPAGAACSLNAHCAGGTCLNWPTGYCTQIDCRTRGCDGDEVCVPLGAGNSVCLAPCSAQSDCRTPHQACKGLQVDEGLVPVCVGIEVGAAGPGRACDDASRCLGAAACVSAFPGGYCAELGCASGTCPVGTTCAIVDRQPMCLLSCFGDGDCGGVEGAERQCGALASPTGEPVQVCVSGVSGRGLGEDCRSDFECSSGSCQILGEGRCNVSGQPCFTADAEEACGVGDYCRITSTSRVGVCSSACAAGIVCAGASQCLREGSERSTAWCRPSCGTGGTSCNADAGLSCRFGLPLGDGGQGRYVCAATGLGGVFFGCNGDAACPGGVCVKPAGVAPGYCARTCGDDDYCGFGGTCVRTESGDSCWRMCLGESDCPTGFTCASRAGTPRTVCVPQ